MIQIVTVAFRFHIVAVNESKAGRVYAIPQAPAIGRPVREDVTQMAVAMRRAHLGADHAVARRDGRAFDDRQQVTLHTLAAQMISISDNTATDHLIHLVGRDAVEIAMRAASSDCSVLILGETGTAAFFRDSHAGEPFFGAAPSSAAWLAPTDSLSRDLQPIHVIGDAVVPDDSGGDAPEAGEAPPADSMAEDAPEIDAAADAPADALAETPPPDQATSAPDTSDDSVGPPLDDDAPGDAAPDSPSQAEDEQAAAPPAPEPEQAPEPERPPG